MNQSDRTQYQWDYFRDRTPEAEEPQKTSDVVNQEEQQNVTTRFKARSELSLLGKTTGFRREKEKLASYIPESHAFGSMTKEKKRRPKRAVNPKKKKDKDGEIVTSTSQDTGSASIPTGYRGRKSTAIVHNTVDPEDQSHLSASTEGDTHLSPWGAAPNYNGAIRALDGQTWVGQPLYDPRSLMDIATTGMENLSLTASGNASPATEHHQEAVDDYDWLFQGYNPSQNPQQQHHQSASYQPPHVMQQNEYPYDGSQTYSNGAETCEITFKYTGGSNKVRERTFSSVPADVGRYFESTVEKWTTG
ncbi:hypothetical protein I302_100092 [Kwoniella bestiolae CBS 10118]|uniref:Uncharacterized protein n=1 Tax=Kwoniella bestiolae CBS 10118 TaxID=1296100 RepID=A0A1B9G460_9TREE|nr:hypothetical protein I302_03464 [Kwoniella bestiolae CBS 10118]OCF25791.1 hypothetical protein I302_03464 [Kwoniella bestiolae CBS 10118]